MRSIAFLLIAAAPAHANILGECPFGRDLGQPDCEDIQSAVKELEDLALPAGLKFVELKQDLNRLFLQTAIEGKPAGDEGEKMKDAVCGLPSWRDLLDREYRMSVRMTYQQDDLTILDEITFIEDCEAH